MKILLTGGAGFIATHTCVELMATSRWNTTATTLTPP